MRRGGMSISKNFPFVKISKDPKVFTETVQKMMNENADIKSAMRGILGAKFRVTERKMLASLKSTIHRLKASKSYKDRGNLSFLISAVSASSSTNSLSTYFKLKRSTIQHYRAQMKYRRKRRKDAVNSCQKNLITDFYEDQSYMLGGKRFTTKKGNQKRVLFTTSFRAYQNWGKNHKVPCVSFSVFHKLRPQHCLPMSKAPHVTGLCEVCVNSDELLIVMKTIGKDHMKAAISGTSPQIPEDKVELVNCTLCTNLADLQNVTCIQRKCKDCGTHLLDQQLKCLDTDSDVKYKHKLWENSRVQKGSSFITKKVLVDHDDNVSEITNKLVVQTGVLASHLFTKDVQQSAFIQAKTSLPPGKVLIVEDFSENYRTRIQREVSSAHFTYEQMSLLTQVAYYKCPESGCQETVAESSIFISPDVIHDTFFIRTAHGIFDEHLAEKSIPCEGKIFFSDGCGSQFKSKKPFKDVSISKVQRNFFGSGHGKSACDALGGLLKRTADRYIDTGQVSIKNAEDLFDFGQKYLQKGVGQKCSANHKLRTFFHIPKVERDTDTEKLVTVPSTRKLHQIRPGDTPGNVLHRNFSCFCGFCMGGEYESCRSTFAGSCMERA